MLLRHFVYLLCLGASLAVKTMKRRKSNLLITICLLKLWVLNLKKLLRARNSLSMEKISEMTPL